MNNSKMSLKMALLALSLLLIGMAWAIGGYYKKGVFLGPYMISGRLTPFYLEFPIIFKANEEKDNSAFNSTHFELYNYKEVAIYDIDIFSLNKARPYPLSNSFPDPFSMNFNFSNTISINEASKIIESQPKHPHYFQNRLQIAFYRFASTFAWIVQYQQVWMAIAGVLAALWLWFFRSPTPFFIWWCLEVFYCLVYRGLYDFHRFTSPQSIDWLIFNFIISPAAMYSDISSYLPFYVCFAGFFVIGPIVLVMMGWVYLTKHVIPKQKRLFEDFFKIDKQKSQKQDLNITDVQFKTLKYDLKKKLQTYLPKDEIFLGVDDDGRDVSIPFDLANHNIHVMGPIGSGKTATTILPVAIQALEKGYGACFIDLKGDYALIKTIQEKCKALGKKFYFFSIDPKEKTENYNPLSSGGSSSKVDRIMTALKLDQEGTARYYSGEQRTAFNEILKDLIEKKEVINFNSILTYLKDSKYLSRLKIDEKDVRGLISAISNIADYPMIGEDGIDLKKIMDDQDVVYFNLRPQINTEVAQAIGRMIIVDFKFWSAYRNEHLPKFFIFIDEFQDIASEFFVDIISKVRNANYCLVLANQSRGNLLNVSQAFHDAVMINSYTKVVFNQFEDAKFWSSVTGTIRIDEAMMRMVSGEMFNEDKTMLDGKRERDGVVTKITKPLFSENTFLKLPKNKSVIFVKGRTACLTNHEFYQTEAEFKKMLKDPFIYEGGKMYGDPLEYLIKKREDKKAEDSKTKEKEDEEKKKKEEQDKINKLKYKNNKGEKNEGNKKVSFGPVGDGTSKLE